MACLECGFERTEEGKSCPVCGAETQSGTIPFAHAPTVAQEDAPLPRRRGAQLNAGEVFAKRYEILGALGRGGMGCVYRVRDLQEESELALKVLHATVEDESAAVRFRREIEILSRVKHPGVVRIFDYGVVGDRMYFVAELIDGDDLRTILRTRGVMPPEEVARIGAAVATALGAAHAHRIVHRDVKPHNIMIRGSGEVTLLDFGVARGMGIDMNTITATGVIVGTPDYMAPEQFYGQRVDARSDVYSLGIVLYELLAGGVPFRADTPVALGMQHQYTLPPPIRTQRPNVPAWLERVVLKCLEKDPANRYLSADDVAKELQRSRAAGERRTRTLPGGEQVIEDDSEATPWALTLATPEERANWSVEMALQFEGRFFRLEDIRNVGGRWFYRFSHWPDAHILRKIVDYEQDAAERAEKNRGLRGKLKGWLG